MLAHSHLLDSHSRARDLAASIQSATSSPQISAACFAVEAFLRHHPTADPLRPFFSAALPALLSRLFGFDDPPSPAWIELPDPDLASRLFDLLAPGGPLMSLVDAVDRKSLLRFSFPIERLPKWMGSLLLHNGRRDADLSGLCPLFKSRTVLVDGTYQVHLNVFEYYMFWFAYYPLCKGACGNPNAAGAAGNRRTGAFALERWASPWPALSRCKRQQADRRKDSTLYLRLLAAYLHAFVPKFGVVRYCQPYRSSLLHYSLATEALSVSRAEFVLHTFVCFWMVDNDFSPLPVDLCEAFGMSFPMLKALGKVPPSAGLGEPLRLLVRYLNGGWSGPTGEASQVELSGHLGQTASYAKLSIGSPVHRNFGGSWNLLMQRPLYRFIARTFLFCPMGMPIENVSQVFSLWISYLQPWKASLEDFTEHKPAEIQNGDPVVKEKEDKGEVSCGTDCMYSTVWSNYVMSNFPFYSSLVVHFLNFAHKFLPNNTETVIQMTLKVIDVLTSTGELTDLLKKINGAYHSKKKGSSSSICEGIYKCIPSIHEQMKDWEDGLSENNEDGTFSHENPNCGLKLFSNSDDGACHLLQLLILCAEPEIRSLPGSSNAKNIQNLESVRIKMSTFFDIPVVNFQSQAPSKAPPNTCQYGQDDVFRPKHPGIGRHRWADIKYEGDPMRSPISEDEVAWLARYLIRLSNLLNQLLGLSNNGGKNSTSLTFVEVPQVREDAVQGAKGGAWMLLLLFGSWILLLFQLVFRFIRGRGWMVNLRFLASKKVITLLLAYVAFSTLRKAFGGCHWGIFDCSSI